MAAVAHDRRRRGCAPGATSTAAAEDDGEEQHLNPFLLDAAPSSSRVQFRNVASRARWVEEAGAAEVLDNKGKLWLTTGIARAASSTTMFLAKRGALVLLDDKDETVGMEDIYGKIATGSYGCSWDAFQAYRHLKLLGYIVGRYDIPWTMKQFRSGDVTNSPVSMDGTSQSFGKANGACNDITKLLEGMRIEGMYPSFKVHLPNSKFKKSSQESLVFLDKPPSRDELETVENKFDGISLKFPEKLGATSGGD
ncbi:hypothetical protein VPH35_091099 [Triticum aestivum]